MQFIGSAAGDYGYVDDPDGTVARFNNPVGVMVDPVAEQKMWVCDFGNQAIREVDLTSPTYGVTTLADLSALDCPHPRWIDVSRETGMIWVTTVNAAGTDSTVITVDPGTGAVMEWISSGGDIYGSIMAGPLPMDLGAGDAYEAGFAVVRQHHNTSWRCVAYSNDTDTVFEFEWLSRDPCDPPDVWLYHRDGAFPSQDAGMAWVHTSDDGAKALLAHDYQYPSNNGLCLIGPAPIDDRFMPHCEDAGTDPADYLPVHTYYDSDGSIPESEDMLTDGTIIRQMARGPDDPVFGGQYMIAPVRRDGAGTVHLIWYDDAVPLGLDTGRNKRIGGAGWPVEAVTYSATDGALFLAMAEDSGSQDTDGFVAAVPLNTIGVFALAGDTPVMGTLESEAELVPFAGMSLTPIMGTLESEADPTWRALFGIVVDMILGGFRSPRPSGFAPVIPLEGSLAAESLPPEPSRRALPLPPWTERGPGVPYRVD